MPKFLNLFFILYSLFFIGSLLFGVVQRISQDEFPHSKRQVSSVIDNSDHFAGPDFLSSSRNSKNLIEIAAALTGNNTSSENTKNFSAEKTEAGLDFNTQSTSQKPSQKTSNFSDLKAIVQSVLSENTIAVDVKKQPLDIIEIFWIGLIQGFPVAAFFFFLEKKKNTIEIESDLVQNDFDLNLGFYSLKKKWDKSKKTQTISSKINLLFFASQRELVVKKFRN